MTQEAKPGAALALVTIGALYITQGMPMGLAFMALPAMLRTLGYSTEAIGMVGIVMLPWALKFLWAPLVDRHRHGRLGPRQSWIVPAQMLNVILYAVLAVIAATTAALPVLLAFLMLANLASATQDIATDGWTIELLRGPDLAWANGLQIGGFSLGMLIGGSATLLLFDQGGWVPALGLLSVLTALSIIPVLMMPRTKPSAESLESFEKPSLKRMLRRKHALTMLAIAGLFYFANALSGAMIGPFLIDAGLSLAEVGLVTGVSVAVTLVVSAAAGGALCRRFGAARVAIISGTVAAFSLALWWVLALQPDVTLPSVLGVKFTIGLASGIAYVAFFTIFMQWASLTQAGTDFTVLQCTESWTNIAAAIIAGQLASVLGYAGNFLLASVTGIGIIAWIAFALRRMSAPKPEISPSLTGETI